MNSVEQDSMRLDVWDFNPEESVNEKLTKINQVTPGHRLLVTVSHVTQH